MKKSLSIILAIVGLTLTPSPVSAIQDPALFSCTNPQGTRIAQYNTGLHGIPGDSGTYTGSDVVYQLDENYVLQCFCPSDSNQGTQSNWWLIPELSEDLISLFVRRGWVYVPNGQLWGLVAAPYLVKNESYACRSGQGGSSGASSSNSNNSDGGTGGQSSQGYVLGASTLGATGTQTMLITYASLGIFSALLAWFIARR